jgi:uncharacterized phage infection (PIP) family protein YhgE
MSNLEAQVLDAIKKNLGSLEVQALNELVIKASQVDSLILDAEDYKRAIAQHRESIQKLEAENQALRDNETAIHHLEAQVNQQRLEYQTKLNAMQIIEDDRAKLFEIVGNGFRQYTQVTSQSRVLTDTWSGENGNINTQHRVEPLAVTEIKELK